MENLSEPERGNGTNVVLVVLGAVTPRNNIRRFSPEQGSARYSYWYCEEPSNSCWMDGDPRLT